MLKGCSSRILGYQDNVHEFLLQLFIHVECILEILLNGRDMDNRDLDSIVLDLFHLVSIVKTFYHVYYSIDKYALTIDVD
mgnify:CR=1 FL=1